MFASTGEGVKDFEVFHPDRMASRILDMGDVLTLIEQAEKAFDRTQAAEMERKFLAAEDFTFDDFLQQMAAIKKMGSLKSILGMMPGMGQMRAQLDAFDEREFDRVEAMVRSMTPFERNHPKQINGSRRARIAKGSGVSTSEVNQLLERFGEAQKMMKQMARGGGDARDAGHARWRVRPRQARPPAGAAAQEVQVRQPGQAGGRASGRRASAPATPAGGVVRRPARRRPGASTRGHRPGRRCRRASRSSWGSDLGAARPGLHTMPVGTAGPRVAFLHGLFGQGRNWTQIAKALAGPRRHAAPAACSSTCPTTAARRGRRSSPTRRMPPRSPPRSRPPRRGSRGCSSGTRSAARSPW